MKKFAIEMENAGFDEVRVTVRTSEPVEFKNHQGMVMTNAAIYANGATVEFRLAGKEPTEWVSLMAQRKSFDTASRFFETGA